MSGIIVTMGNPPAVFGDTGTLFVGSLPAILASVVTSALTLLISMTALP